LVLPLQLALNYGNITHAGPVSDIADVVRNVRELDISNNQISQWHEVLTSHFMFKHTDIFAALLMACKQNWKPRT